MNKLILLSLLTVFSVGSTFGQDIQPRKRFQLGVIGGKTILGSYQRTVPWEKIGGGFAGLDVSYAFAKEDPNFTLRF